MCVEISEDVSRSQVKGQGHYTTECYNGGGMRFDGVASRLSTVHQETHQMILSAPMCQRLRIDQ